MLIVHKGESIPLVCSVSLPIATVQSEHNALVFSTDAYFLVNQKSMCISPDGQRWGRIDDIQAQRELFGFSKGEVAVGFSGSKESRAKFTLDVRMK